MANTAQVDETEWAVGDKARGRMGHIIWSL